MKKTIQIAVLSVFFLASCGKANTGPAAKEGGTTTPVASVFTNPLLSTGPDPWVAQKDGMYYFTCTLGDHISVYPTAKMSLLNKTLPQRVYTPPGSGMGSMDLWAPEIHFLQGKWYIYFTADDGNDANHRLYVLQSNSASPTSGFTLKGKLTPATDKWAIDGTVLTYNNQLYLIWSGWNGDYDAGNQQLYIAAMSDPVTVSGDRVQISKPDYPWETVGGRVNEGPEVLINAQGTVFLTYSASSCFQDSYALGLLTLKQGGNPLNPADWTKTSTPVFTTNTAAGAYGPGHNGFFISPDGTQNWLIYHANSAPGQGCGNTRNPRMQQFTWSADGSPAFGTPAPVNTNIPVPSGE